ncbi:MAG: DUF2484 family protein [Rhodobacteraceae bacterium]|nr:DUF2484 family protein [Paracoccaceae bacterium]
MSSALITACLWVLAATATAILPGRLQRTAGFALLAVAPVLLVWIALTHGWMVCLACLAAVVSMYREPLGTLLRKRRGDRDASAP